MSEVAEDSDDGDPAYISSDESAHGVDPAETFRVKPSRDIWELGKICLKAYSASVQLKMSLNYII